MILSMQFYTYRYTHNVLHVYVKNELKKKNKPDELRSFFLVYMYVEFLGELSSSYKIKKNEENEKMKTKVELKNKKFSFFSVVFKNYI